MAPLSTGVDCSIPSWGRWLVDAIALAKADAPLEPVTSIPLSWRLIPSPGAPKHPWLVARGHTTGGVKPYLVVSWQGIVEALCSFAPPPHVRVAAYRARDYLAASDSVFEHLLTRLVETLPTNAKAPRSDDPAFLASLAAHARRVAQSPANVRRWAVSVRRALVSVAPSRLQVYEDALVVDPALVANSFARKNIKPVPSCPTGRFAETPFTEELLWLLSCQGTEGAVPLGSVIVLSWEDYTQSYLDLGCSRPLYAARKDIDSTFLRQAFCSALPERVFVPDAPLEALVSGAGFDINNGRYAVLSIPRLRALLSRRRNLKSLPEEVRGARVAAKQRACLVYNYAGLDIRVIRRKETNYFTPPFDAYGPFVEYDGQRYYSLDVITRQVDSDDPFIGWASELDARLTNGRYKTRIKKATDALRTAAVRQNALGGVGVFAPAEDAVIREYFDLRPCGPLKREEVIELASRLPGRTPVGVRRRVITLLRERAKLAGWDYFRQSSWWPGGQMAQSIYASCRKRGSSD